MKDLIRIAGTRAQPLQYATGGRTTTPHLAGELLWRAAGIKVDHVPYKGMAASLIAVLAAEVPLALDFPIVSAPHVQSGKLKAILVTGRDPVPTLPRVPTAARAGFPDFDITAWMGLFLPAGTARPIAEKLHVALARIPSEPDFKAQLAADGSDLKVMQIDEFRTFVRADQAKWARIVKEAGIRAE